MAFSISIGDAILLAQIAGRLAKTFTKGRASAPAEFQEVENELYSLSAALTAAENEQESVRPTADQEVCENNRHIANQQIFEHILRNCKHTLAHLEEIVKKYMIVSEQTDIQKPKLERWSHAIVKNWRKVEWTTEKGDLNTLRSQIMLHTNSLNLLINISTRYALSQWRKHFSDNGSSRAASIERSLNKKLVLLEELHQWYVTNLKEAEPKCSTTSGSLINASENTSLVQPLDAVSTFELAREIATGDEIICPRASVKSEWIESFLDGILDPSSGSMFVCNCLDRHSGMLSHQHSVEIYGRK